ncbi:adenosylhomocysteinase [Halobaculum sp. D14]|uniref:adenosylhomocysteinase n=1 Tax=Halobaculum sp. D14 TaxID=3421642 RepID=UPI003EB8C24C
MKEVELTGPAGADPLAWTRESTPLLRGLADDLRRAEPFAGMTAAVASHLEPKTGVFIETVAAGGADVLFTGSDPDSGHEAVIDHLDDQPGLEAFAAEGMTEAELDEQHHRLLDREPDLLFDDGCVLAAKLHDSHGDALESVVGVAEQTTSGVHRLEAMAADDVLAVPAFAVNHTPMKRRFDNVHGTGESAVSNVQLTANRIVSGETVVVAGYGHVGRGVAEKARGIGAHTVVVEVDPRKALEAHMDGHRVASMADAAADGDVFVTATGVRDVVREEHFREMHDDVLLANAGHYDVEIDVDALRDLAESTSTPRAGVTRFHLPDGRRLNLFAEGRLVNLSGPYSQGHPAAVMDSTFAMMTVAGRELVEADLSPAVHAVPDRLDREVARKKADAVGVPVEDRTDEQAAYLEDWRRE